MKRIFVTLVATCVALSAVSRSMASEDSEAVSARAAKLYTVKVVAGSNGKVSGKKTVKVKSGGKVEYTVTPSKGYLIDTLTVNGAPSKKLPSKTGKPYTLKISKIAENKTVNATFAKKRTVRPLSVGSQITVVDAKK
jgi:hypothetical protein